MQDDEPTLLLTESDESKGKALLLNERDMVPRLKKSTDKKVESNVWYLDNGASNHMTRERAKFKELNEKVTGQVKFGDRSTVEIKSKGLVGFKCKNGEEIELRYVYYIPTLCSNIISLGHLSETGKKVVLNGVYLWIYDEQLRLLMKVKRSANRLYKLSCRQVKIVA